MRDAPLPDTTVVMLPVGSDSEVEADLFFFWFFETGFLCVTTLAVLELAL